MVCSQAIVQNFTIWYDSVHDSIANESKCGGGGGGGGGHFPSKPAASSACGFAAGMAMNGNDFAAGHVAGVLSEAYLTCLCWNRSDRLVVCGTKPPIYRVKTPTWEVIYVKYKKNQITWCSIAL